MITVKEAKRLEDSFLGGITEAQDAYEQIVANEAWTVLGYDTFTEWWAERVHPLMRQLSMFPNRKLAAKVIEQVRTDEAELPAAQRRTQRELAELVGVSQGAPVIRPRSTPESNLSEADLAQPPADPADPLPPQIAEQIDQRIAERVTRPVPPRMTAAELADHEAGVARVREIAAAQRQATTIVAEFLAAVVTVVTGCRYGEKGLVTKDMVQKLREGIDLLEGEL